MLKNIEYLILIYFNSFKVVALVSISVPFWQTYFLLLLGSVLFAFSI